MSRSDLAMGDVDHTLHGRREVSGIDVVTQMIQRPPREVHGQREPMYGGETYYGK